ncbi:MAG: beta-N-acetylhexosaminidase [Polyangiales bacterium]
MDDVKAIEVACGQLLFVGFDGTELPVEVVRAFEQGLRGGAILFRRNVKDLDQVAKLNASIIAACPVGLPPVIGVDQEGGRVKRLGPPALQVPPMRALATRGEETVERVAHAVGRELAALGFSMSFAPVLDVDSNPKNPIIGDRSFGSDPETVARMGIAYARGLARARVLSCGKHFPGHGDTEEDSHLSLPRVRHDRARIEAIELAPFRAAKHLDAFMTAHVVFDALDPGVPATLSRATVTTLLREEIGFEGVCISDDLFMKGISPSGGADVRELAEAGVRAVEAGCDLLLVCHAGPAADAVHAALVDRARTDTAFEARVRDACARGLAMRRRCPPSVAHDRAAIFAETARALD